MLTRPDHVTIAVTDLPAARGFFETLGFRTTVAVVISGPQMAAYMGVPGIEADHVTMVLDGAPVHFEIQLLHYRHPVLPSRTSPVRVSTTSALPPTTSRATSPASPSQGSACATR
jgi:catechol 2,3-dioxygenase-like lactoylglutathione lyase family enzyme